MSKSWSFECCDFATVDDWWALTEKYPHYRTVSNALLKDWGYLRLFELIGAEQPERILEFGHGFSDKIFSHPFGYEPQLWGLDQDQDLPYFPSGDEYQTRREKQLLTKFPAVQFSDGLLGNEKNDLPDNYFDLICSVSVLEELDTAVVFDAWMNALSKLRSGGLFANSFDFRCGLPSKLGRFTQSLRRERPLRKYDLFSLLALASHRTKAMWKINSLLIENPSVVRLGYEQGDFTPKFGGHWTSAFVVVRKR